MAAIVAYGLLLKLIHRLAYKFNNAVVYYDNVCNLMCGVCNVVVRGDRRQGWIT